MEKFYVKLYKEGYSNRPLLNGMNFECIYGIKRSMLGRSFSEEEVWRVSSSMKWDKAPSPDGFTISFFQKC